MEHHFNTEVAQRIDIPAAVFVHHLAYWIKKNEANDKHFNNGYYWTYNSIRAYANLFPYWSNDQVKRIIKKLEDQNIIESAVLNARGYDRTKWYAIIDPAILRIYQIHFAESPNGEGETAQSNEAKPPKGIGETAQPIPDSKPSSKTDSKPSKKDYSDLIDDLNKKEIFKNWVKYRTEIKKPLKSEQTLKGLALKFNVTDLSTILIVVSKSINNQWQGLFWEQQGLVKNTPTSSKVDESVEQINRLKFNSTFKPNE